MNRISALVECGGSVVRQSLCARAVRVAFGLLALAGCAAPTPTAHLATMTPTLAPPTASLTLTRIPTSVPAASTSTPDRYALPPGKAGIIIRNFHSQNLIYAIGNSEYHVPSGGEKFVLLDPGDYKFTVSIRGRQPLNGIQILIAGQLVRNEYN